jgi:hypothetical protein
VKIIRKIVAMFLYAVLLLPGAEYRMSSWLKAVEASTAVVDRTMRRRKSRVESDRLSRYLASVEMPRQTPGQK